MTTFGTARVPGLLGTHVENLAQFSGFGLGNDVKPLEPSAFPNIERIELMRTLRQRVENPQAIDQAGSSLCGPASLMYILATKRSAMYFRFVVELYERGSAMLGSLRVAPGEDCRNYTPGTKLAAADWVALASLRDSENAIFDLDEVEDRFAGITMPNELVGWLNAVGFSNVLNETNLFLTKGEDDFRQAAQLASQGYKVCLLVDAAGIQTGASERGALRQIFTVPNHWIVLDTIHQLAPESVEFSIYTWGKPKKNDRTRNGMWLVPQDSTPMTLEHWLKYFYGYVACKA